MDDLISRDLAIKTMMALEAEDIADYGCDIPEGFDGKRASDALRKIPSAQPTLYGYNIEHLELIARVLQKENLPPERIVEILTDIGRIVAIVKDEFEETLRKVAEQCTI